MMKSLKNGLKSISKYFSRVCQNLESFNCEALNSSENTDNVFQYISPNIKEIIAYSPALDYSSLLSMAQNDQVQLTKLDIFYDTFIDEDFYDFSNRFVGSMTLIGDRFENLKSFVCNCKEFNELSTNFQIQVFRSIAKLVNLEELYLLLDFDYITEQQIQCLNNCRKLEFIELQNDLMSDQMLKIFLKVFKYVTNLTEILVFSPLITIQSMDTCIEFAKQRPEILIEFTFDLRLKQRFQDSKQTLPQNLKFKFEI